MSDKKTNAVRAVENLKIDYEILKYEVDDMRLLYENDVRFLRQF